MYNLPILIERNCISIFKRLFKTRRPISGCQDFRRFVLRMMEKNGHHYYAVAVRVVIYRIFCRQRQEKKRKIVAFCRFCKIYRDFCRQIPEKKIFFRKSAFFKSKKEKKWFEKKVSIIAANKRNDHLWA